MRKAFSIFFLTSLIIMIYSCNSGQESKEKSIPKKKLHTEIGFIQFDQTITKFKLATVHGEKVDKFIFSPNGDEDLKSTIPVSGFYFQPIKGLNFEEAKNHLKEFSLEYKKQPGIKNVEDNKEAIMTVNGAKAYTVTFTTIDGQNNKNIVTQGILSTGKDALLFFGNDVDNGKYSTEFSDTFKSIEL